jgi:hypothetical protein
MVFAEPVVQHRHMIRAWCHDVEPISELRRCDKEVDVRWRYVLDRNMSSSCLALSQLTSGSSGYNDVHDNGLGLATKGPERSS